MYFTGHVSTGTDLVINFDLVKCITKINKNSYPNYNGKVEGGLSPKKVKYICISKMYFQITLK